MRGRGKSQESPSAVYDYSDSAVSVLMNHTHLEPPPGPAELPPDHTAPNIVAGDPWTIMLSRASERWENRDVSQSFAELSGDCARRGKVKL